MILSFIGSMGSGKTLSLVREAKNYYDKGYKIFSNIHLTFPHIKISRSDLLDYANRKEQFKNSFFLVDEFAIFVGDSRRSASERNIAISYFIVMTRKLGIILGLTSQTWNMIEKRVRENTDIFIECKSFQLSGGVVLIRNRYQASNGKSLQKYFKGNSYFSLYDTLEIVDFKN